MLFCCHTLGQSKKRKSLFSVMKKDIFDQAEHNSKSILSFEHLGLPGNIRHFFQQPCDHFSEFVHIFILGSLGILNGLNQNLLITLRVHKTCGTNLLALYFISVLCMHAKSLQSCPTLCDPMAYILPDCPWDSPGRTAEVGCHLLPQGIFLAQQSNSYTSALAGRFFFFFLIFIFIYLAAQSLSCGTWELVP